METYIQIDNVSKVYSGGSVDFVALSDVDLTIQRGEFVTIMGPSGSGKSTLMHLIGAMDTPCSGKIRVGDEHLTSRSAKLSQWRANTVGFVFQRAFLLPGLTAVENVEVPLMSRPIGAPERRRRASLALDLVGLTTHEKHKPRELSGGQEQLTALARAIVTDPPLLLCDEPTGNLDRESADAVLHLLRVMSTERKKTVLVVTHDPKVASYSDRIVHIEKGRLVGESSPDFSE